MAGMVISTKQSFSWLLFHSFVTLDVFQGVGNDLS